MASIRHVPADRDVGEMAKILNDDGVIIIDRLLDTKHIDELLSFVQPMFDAQNPGGEQFGGAKKGIRGIFAIDRKFSDYLLTNRTVNDVTRIVLQPGCYNYRLTVAGASEIWGGGEDQFLHREMDIYSPFLPYRPDMPEYNCFTMFAASDFTRENGATRIVPGSHRWPADRPSSSATPDEIAQAEMEKGSALMWLGKIVHGAGQNRTDKPRRSFNISFSANWLAQEENQYILYPKEIAGTLSREAQQLLGYTASNLVGWVQGKKSESLLEVATSDDKTGPVVYLDSKWPPNSEHC